MDREGSLFLLMSSLIYFLLSGPPVESKVIRIQSDFLLLLLRRLLPWTVQSDLLCPSLLKRARVPSERPPLAFSPKSWVGSYFSFSSLMMLSTTLPSLEDRRNGGALSADGTALSSRCCSLLPSFWVDIACTGDDFREAYSMGATDCVSGFSPFGHLSLQWSGWASLLAGEEHLRGF